MDRRTLIFVITLSMAMFAVNAFFDYRSDEARKEWTEQQLAKKSQKVQQLEQEITSRTAQAEQLPLVNLYGDDKAATFLTTGILDDNAVVTLAWAEQLPEQVWVKQNGGTEKFTLQNPVQGKELPAIYRKGEATPLRVGYLPDFGSYELQVVTLSPHNTAQPYKISVANFVDGHFEMPQEELDKIKEELGKEDENAPPRMYDNGIALIKIDSSWLPVAVFHHHDKRLLFLNEVEGISTSIVRPDKLKVVSGQRAAETYYVLENDYQQLVFSSYGGALVEMNLPFDSKSDKESAVKPIEFDREMVEKHPYNAYFPAHPYLTAGQTATGPFVEHDKGALGGYYPLIRRDLIEKQKGKSVRIAPQYYALNIVSQYPEVAELVYEVKEFSKDKIVFEAMQSNRRITKTFAIDNTAPYSLHLTVDVEGDSRGLWLTSGVPEAELISGAIAPALKYRFTRGTNSEVNQIDLPTDAVTVSTVSPDWICNSNGFFGIILDALNEVEPGYRALFVPGTTVPSRLVEIGQEYDQYKAQDLPGYQLMLPLRAKGGKMEFRVFAGPFSTPILKAVDEMYSNPETGYNPDYIACQSFHGWFAFISEPFAKFLFMLMNFFHYLTGSWALSIVLLTIALRVMLYPLNAWSTKSMLQTQELMPKVQALQAKYKSDPKKAQLEILNLYKEHGLNPLSGITGGCFPLLIQMPFLIGMFDLLKSSFQLRGAVFIPGWIDNLSAPDVLFSWSMPLPLIGNEFHLLPIILGVIMFIQPRMMQPLPADKSQWTEQQRQQRAMTTMMAVMFCWLFYNFPSGLNIYWISSMLLGILQQWWTKKQMKPLSTVEIVNVKSNVKSKR